jgi:hypothetical protein
MGAHVSKPSGDVEFPPGRRDNRDTLCPMPGCGMRTRKLKDHAFKVHLSPFFRVPGKVTGVDKALFRTETLSTTSSRTGREFLVAMTETSVTGDSLTAISRTRPE